METGTLYIVATPIGNLADITLRALDVLRRADLIAAEDTRRTRKLLSHYDIHKPLTSYHSNNARKRGPELLAKLDAGASIALVTDAGMPGISDPGSLLVAEAAQRQHQLVAVPGPSAVTSALAISGLPTHPFVFLGFPPQKGGQRRRFFARHEALPMTLVLFESPMRLSKTLRDLRQVWGNRRVAVARELTKRFEEVYRGTLAAALDHFQGGTKGEITLVVEGAGAIDVGADADAPWQDELRTLLERDGLSVRSAVKKIQAHWNVPKNTLYQEALSIQSQPEQD